MSESETQILSNVLYSLEVNRQKNVFTNTEIKVKTLARIQVQVTD